jgi:general secretion pathway protein B
VSYILDALRRADSERERGAVPGLHAQPVPPLSVEAPPRAAAKPWHWIAIGVGAGLLVSAGWYVAGRSAARVEPAVAEPAAAPPTLARGAPVELPPAAPVAAIPAAPAPWPEQESRKPASRAAARHSDTQDGAPGAAPAEPAVIAREQLPDHLRAELPPLAIGGSMYSSTPANRSLIIDGRLVREKEQLGADLSLEQINLKTAVFRYKGHRFEIRF